MSEGVQQRQELADQIRNRHRHSSRKLRVATLVSVSIGVVACVFALFWVQLRPTVAATIVKTPSHATEDYGFLVTQSVLVGEDTSTEPDPALPVVQLFDDFLCESCRVFHEETGGFLTDEVANGTITLSLHPFSFLHTQSVDEYSQRATNAAVCAADEAGVRAYLTMHKLLLQNQPAQGGSGHSNDRLIEFAAEAGAANASECIEGRTFTPWVEEATRAAFDADVTQTPTVRIGGNNIVRSENGRISMPGEAELKYAIEAQQ